MSKSSAGVCSNADSDLNSSSRKDDQDIFTRHSETTNDKKRPATRLIGGNASEDAKRQRKNLDESTNDPTVSTSTSNIQPFESAEISTENNVASSNDLDSRRTKTSDDEVDAAAEGIVDMEFPNDDINCSSALSSACSSPIHRSSTSDQSAEKESGNESASAASGSSVASSASCSSSSYQCPPAPPTTPITGYKPYVEAQVKDNRAFYNVATPKPSAYGFPPSLPTDSEMIAPAGPHSQSTASTTEAEPVSPAQEDSAENRSDDFDSWKVGKRYELIRILGRGSYGEVAQAKDLQQPRTDGNSPKYVAIKRISTAFQQDVDALRFFREIHLLRRLREHDCIIQLIDVVEPEIKEDLDDIYLIFECKSVYFAENVACMI
jgi:hypothetical protein